MNKDLRPILKTWHRMAAEPNMVVLDGFHALKHALRFGADIRQALAADRQVVLALAGAHAPDISAQLESLLQEVTKDDLEKLVGGLHPTGVIALADREKAPRLTTGKRSPLVLLDMPRHPGNVGAAIRVTAGMGAAGVLTTGDLDPWHPYVLRGSAGLHFAVPVMSTTLENLPRGPLLAFDAGGEDLFEIRIPQNAILAFGSERRGLSPEVRALAATIVALPMQPNVSSYNLATSVAMALYHWRLSGLMSPAKSR